MDLSFWERSSWFSDVDYTIVGSGIVGLFTALRLRARFPVAKILILEKGVLPQGASTKNAGFACFGSMSEILDDLTRHSEAEVISLIERRWNGLRLLRDKLGDEVIGYKNYGGYELFLQEHKSSYQQCISGMPAVNNLLRGIFGEDVFTTAVNNFGFAGLHGDLIYNKFEAQINTGDMMQALLKKAIAHDILILNRQTVTKWQEDAGGIVVSLGDFSFHSGKLLFATNGFAEGITAGKVRPARAQVIVTAPINGLAIRGTFHIDQGYYYFRNVGDRLLFGGGRNLAFKEETTTEFGTTEIIQRRLETLLKEVILPGVSHTIDQRWSGIMGMGDVKTPVVTRLSEHTYCGVRLGGMGVAIGSLIGTELADLI